MSCIPNTMPTLLVAAVAPRITGKFIKNGLSVFERGEIFLKNGVLHFVFTFGQLSEIALEKLEIT